MIKIAYDEAFPGPLDPVVVATALQREANQHKQAIDGDRMLVSNDYAVELCSDDYDALALIVRADQFAQSLAQAQAEFIGKQGWVVYGDVTVSLDRTDDLKRGCFRITAAVESSPIENEDDGLAESAPTVEQDEASNDPRMSPTVESALRLNMIIAAWVIQRRLINVLGERVDRLTQRIGEQGTPAQPSGPDPIDWFSLEEAEREEALEALGEFVAALVRRYSLQQEILPCWWQHGEAIEELTALWQARQVAYARGSDASMASWWQDLLERSRMRCREMFVVCRHGHVATPEDWMSDEQQAAFTEYRRRPPRQG